MLPAGLLDDIGDVGDSKHSLPGGLVQGVTFQAYAR